MLGNMLQGRDQQYVASKDETTNTWRVLDTWNSSLKNLQVDDDVPDDSPAVTVLTEGAFIALIKEAARTGILENATFGNEEGDYAEHEAALVTKEQEISQLNNEILRLNEEKMAIKREVSHTEDYELKGKAMDSILKLVSLQDMSNLGHKESKKS